MPVCSRYWRCVALPKCSLIIVAWDNYPLTQRFVMQCLHNTIGDLEVIVIDNGSTDATPQWLDGMVRMEDRLRFLRNEENEGYPRGLNQGLLMSRGEYLVALNNDLVVFSDEWLQDLIAPLKADPRQLVGMRLIKDNHQVRVDGWTPDYLEGCCLAFHRQFLTDVGYFDEAYSPAFVEDVDLSWRATQHGYALHPVTVGLYHLYGQTTYVTHRSETKFWEITPPHIAYFREKVRAGRDEPCMPEGI